MDPAVAEQPKPDQRRQGPDREHFRTQVPADESGIDHRLGLQGRARQIADGPAHHVGRRMIVHDGGKDGGNEARSQGHDPGALRRQVRQKPSYLMRQPDVPQAEDDDEDADDEGENVPADAAEDGADASVSHRGIDSQKRHGARKGDEPGGNSGERLREEADEGDREDERAEQQEPPVSNSRFQGRRPFKRGRNVLAEHEREPGETDQDTRRGRQNHPLCVLDERDVEEARHDDVDRIADDQRSDEIGDVENGEVVGDLVLESPGIPLDLFDQLKNEGRENEDGRVVGENHPGDSPATEHVREEPAAVTPGRRGDRSGKQVEESGPLGNERDDHEAHDGENGKEEELDGERHQIQRHEAEAQAEHGAEAGGDRVLDTEPPDARPHKRQADGQSENRKGGDPLGTHASLPPAPAGNLVTRAPCPGRRLL